MKSCPGKMKKVKIAVLLSAPTAFLSILALGLDERNSVTYDAVQVFPNKRFGHMNGGWNDTTVEVIVGYKPSLVRRLQLVFTKYPEVYPILGGTYLVDESGKKYSKFVLSSGSIGPDVWSGRCLWEGCVDDREEFLSFGWHSFRYSFRFPFILKQVPSSAGRVFLHAQFEAYGTLHQELTIPVRG